MGCAQTKPLGKVKALTEMPQPENSAAIRRFLGMVNYLARFIPHLSDLCEPLRKAMNNEYWQWTEECTEAFRKTKEEIANATVLRYFNPQEQAVIQCDASSTGLGAVLLQQGQPIVFASRALSRAETNYCQIEKEMLAIVFLLRRSDQYVYGQHVTVESDHQPLEIILKKPLKDVMRPRRLQRMILELQRYTITVQYRKGSDLFLPDTLSRAYLPSTDCDYDTDERVCMFFSQRELEDIRLISDETAISDERLTEIADHTNQDSLLQNLKKVIQNGWPNCKSKVSVELRPYFISGMNTSPAQRLMSRPTKTLLPVLPGEFNQNRSTQQDCVSREQRLIRQQQHYNKTARCLPPLEVGCHVFVRPTRLGCHQWKEGIIRNGPDHYRSYSVQLTSGQVLRRNRRDLRLSRTAPSDPEKELMADEWERASVGEPDPVETKAVSTPESNRPVGDYITRYGRTSNVTNLYGNPMRY